MDLFSSVFFRAVIGVEQFFRFCVMYDVSYTMIVRQILPQTCVLVENEREGASALLNIFVVIRTQILRSPSFTKRLSKTEHQVLGEAKSLALQLSPSVCF